MVDKVSASIRDAVATVKDGSTVMTGGFGAAGVPDEVIEGLLGKGRGNSPWLPTMLATAIPDSLHS